MQITIAMIAKEAGVSRGTVDRVINKRGNVKPEVEKRVQEVIDRLGYKPNKIARALSYSKTPKKIAVIYRESGDQFEVQVKIGVEKAREDLSDFGISIILKSYRDNDIDDFLRVMDEIIGIGVDAIALNALNHDVVAEKINSVMEQGIHVVVFNSDVEHSNRYCFVGQDLYKSGRVAGGIMAKLLKPGKRMIILSSDPKLYASQERVNGFISKFRENGIDESCIELYRTRTKYDMTYKALEEAFSEDDNIGGIYLANESNAACGDFIASRTFTEKPVVICHDVNVETIGYVRNGHIDYIIDQRIYEQSYNAIMILKDILRLGIYPPETNIISDLSIINIDCI